VSTFTNDELRNWCAGDEMSDSGKRDASSGELSADSYGGVYVGIGSRPMSASRCE
jgi:hypothetical protein